MDDSEWGDVNLDDAIPLDPENISEWYGVASMVEDLLKGVDTITIPTSWLRSDLMPTPSRSYF
jgi:hypothetical protein